MQPETPSKLPKWKGISIADWLGSADADALAEIGYLLDRSGSEAIEALCLLLSSEGHRFQTSRLRARIVLGVLSPLCVGSLLLAPALLPFALTGLVSITVSALLFFPIWFFCYEASQAPRRRLRNVAALLSRYHAVATAGAWLDTLEIGDTQTERLAATALTEVLPLLQASDAPLLTFTQQARLHRILLRNQVELMLATLQALERIGTVTAIPYVVQLTQHPAATEKELLLRNAASECLVSLRRRAQEQSNTETLLRAVSLPPNPPHLLLHTVNASPEWEASNVPRRASSEPDA